MSGLWLLIGAVVVNVTGWIPRDVSQFWVEPDQPAVFYFDAKVDSAANSNGASVADGVDAVIRNTDGDVFWQGKGTVDGDSMRVETTLPQGYFELEFPQTAQTFGVSCQPAFCPEDALLASEAEKRTDLRRRDGFFGIDSASTWLVADPKACEDLIRNARRIGIATYRERLNWSRIEPKEGVLNYGAERNSELIREAAKRYDVPILELFHNAPQSWVGGIGTYPRDLIKTADSWGRIGEYWNESWNSFEVWNEPDISFSGNLPGDQYVPVLKTVAQEFKRRNISTPIVGGIIASFDDGFMNCICDNGVLDACDIFSFHTYCRAPQMEDVSMRYLKWLERNHAEWKPVWITECGRPWSKGTSRPNREADLESAIDIVQKGVAAKAMGIDAYFPFVYVFYEENDNNFGMSDRNNAPLRSIAGYARSIYLLSGSRCVGSWDVEGAERSYLFVDNDTKDQVAVLYASSRQNGRTVQLPAAPSFVERVTGERLTVSPDNVVDFSDGFLFVSYPSDAELVLKESAEVDAARRLRLAANIKHGPDPRRNFSTAVRFDYDPEILTANRAGYLIKDSNAERLEGRISVYNFDATAKTLPIEATAANCVDEKLTPADELILDVPKSVEVPARGVATFSFTADVAKTSPLCYPTFNFKVGGDGFLSFTLSRDVSEENFNKIATTVAPVDLSELARWQKRASSHGLFEFNSNPDKGGWGFQIKFNEGDKWAYPVFKLPLEIGADGKPTLLAKDGKKYDLTSFKGIVFTVKAESDAPGGVVRVFTYTDKGEYFFTSQGVASSDGQKQFVALFFNKLNPYGGTSGAFDLSKVVGISVGANSQGAETTLEVEDFAFFR